MSFARIRLLVAVLLFVGWLGWLGTAVWYKGTVQIVSRAQVTAASHLVVAEITSQPDGRPLPAVTVKQVLRQPTGEALAGTIEVRGLPGAATPLPIVEGRRTSPPAGEYLLPLVKGENGFALAGLPRSPGYEGTLEHPVIYPWTDDVRAQLRKWKLLD